MSEEQKDPKKLEASESTPPETENSQLFDPQQEFDSSPIEDPQAQSAGPRQPDAAAQSSDYVSEIRENLASEEISAGRKSGGLIRRITGSLRRVTGPLRKQTGPLPEEIGQDAPQTPPPSIEVADDFLASRMAGAAASEPAAPRPDQIQLPSSWEQPETNLFASDAAESAPDEPGTASTPLFRADLFSDDEPLESDPFAVAQRSGAESDAQETIIRPAAGAEEEHPPYEPDWMTEIRSSAAEPSPRLEDLDLPAEDSPKPGGTQDEPARPPARSGPLSFITGLLRGSEARRRPANEEMPDDMVAGRLERSLGQSPDTASAEDAAAEESLAPVESGSVPLFSFDEDLASRFDQVGELSERPLVDSADPQLDQSIEPYDDSALPAISAEDERILWGDGAPVASFPDSGPTFTREDVWGDESAPADQDASPAPGRKTVDDLFAEGFLTAAEGSADHAGTSQDQLLREALEKNAPMEEPVSFETLRQIALEGYQEKEDPRSARASAETADAAAAADAAESPTDSAETASIAAAEAAASAAQAEVLEEWEEKAHGPGFSLRRWLAKRTAVEKFLLVEAVVVALVLLVAIPLFVYLINRGPAAQAGYLIPRPLPANFPYPTRVELPGGWPFLLAKSTFVEGSWKPAAPEWLDGTELRRVVALPWNPQTEAVFRTLKSGDLLLLTFSNGEMADYTITSVERVASSNNAILTDTKPSLVIILYQEDADERWVIFSKP